MWITVSNFFVLGSGMYADDRVGGISTTGHGEAIVKVCLSYRIINLIKQSKNKRSLPPKTAYNKPR